MSHRISSYGNDLYKNRIIMERMFSERYKKKSLNVEDVMIQRKSITRKEYVGKVISLNKLSHKGKSHSTFPHKRKSNDIFGQNYPKHIFLK